MIATETGGARHDARDSRRGWLLVALGVCMLMTIWGAVFTFTVYADRLAATFALSTLRVSSVFSVTIATFLVAGSVFGVLAARFPLRPVVAMAGVGLVAAASAFQVVTSYVGVVAAFGLLGVSGGTVFITVVSLVPQWFDAHQGGAMGITMTGSGLGVLVLPFVWLRLFDRTGFRTAIGIVVGAAAVVVLASSLVYRRPRDESRSATTIDTAWIRARITDPRFVSAAFGYGFLWCWYYVLSSRLVDILTTAGISATVAATSFGTIGGVSIVSRIGSGVVGDRVGRRETFTTGVVVAGVCVLALSAVHTRLSLYLTLVGFGVSLGALAPLWSPIVVTRFGAENATATVGLLKLPQAGAAFAAPLAVSVLFGLTDGYADPLTALSVVTVLGASLFYWGTAPKSE
ncbi:MAG: nitrate/nitrite transporter [Haloplanus sp.]